MPLFELLCSSSATPAFRHAVESFIATGRPNEHIVFSPTAPPIKVERTLTKIVGTYSKLPIERVEINGTSGCDYFIGQARIHTTTDKLTIEFDWNCRWKAMQMGWIDYFGFPDQTRAAREFGYDCFKAWSPGSTQPAAEPEEASDLPGGSYRPPSM